MTLPVFYHNMMNEKVILNDFSQWPFYATLPVYSVFNVGILSCFLGLMTFPTYRDCENQSKNHFVRWMNADLVLLFKIMHGLVYVLFEFVYNVIEPGAILLHHRKYCAIEI